jgi:hypothetical protein
MFRITLCSIVCCCLAAPAAIAAPSLERTEPLAVAPGSSAVLTLVGKELASPTAFWTSIPSAEAGVASGEAQSAERAAYQLNVPANTPLGIAGVRVATAGGASNLRLVMIDDLPTARDQQNNHSIEAAQEISQAIAIDGACQAEQSDFYKFSALAGQRLSVDTLKVEFDLFLDDLFQSPESQGSRQGVGGVIT